MLGALRRSASTPRRSVSREAAFLLLLLAGAPGPARAITITEIMYYPPGAPGERSKGKFIEIFNDSPTTADLSGYHFGEGVTFEFPPGSMLGPRKYLVVCADQNEVRTRYGISNVIGDFGGELSRFGDGDHLVLLDAGGAIAAEVDFRDRSRWTSIPTGTGYTLCLVQPFASTSRPENWVPSRRVRGTPGAENFPPPFVQETELFGENSIWRYRKGWDGTQMAAFSEPPDAWRRTAFDDSGWATGPTGIGFGATGSQTLLSDMMGNYLAFAARKKFTLLPEIYGELESAVLRIKVDDGFVAYLNGEEIGRINLGTEVDVRFDKAATTSRSITQPVLLPIPKEKLLPGENVLSVQVHNQTLTGNDAAFIPTLLWRKTVSDEGRPRSPARLNELLREPGPAGGGRWLEIHNSSDAPLDLGGFFLTDDPALPDRFTVPQDRTIPARGFITFSDGELGLDLAGRGQIREVRLYLIEPDRSTVADAVILDTRATANGAALSQARLPDGGPSWFISTTPTPGSGNEVPLEREVVLNEIMYHPLVSPALLLADGRSLEKGEYVELHNRSSRSISLAGWALTKGYNYAFPQGTVIGPGGYLVVAPDPQYIRETHRLAAGSVLGPQDDPGARASFGALSNAGETVQLEDALGNNVQEVRYSEGGEWSSFADAGGSSLELIDPFQDNTVPHAWEPSDETRRAPWTEYTYTANNVAGAESELWLILISEGECLIDDVSIKRGEIEYIPNGGFEAAALSPWRADGNHIRSRRYTDEAHGGLASLLLSATAGGDNRVNHVEVDTTPRVPGGAVTVSFWARWLKGGQRLHTSGYNNNALAVNHLLSIPPDLGTPGGENSVRARLRAQTGSDNLGPVSSEVRHLPAVPAPGVPVRVLARISDSDGIEEARVEYRLGRRNAPTLSVPLLDDGQNGDGEAGDGLYGGQIPPQSLNVKVLFNVVATDAGERARKYPPDAPNRTLLYQVSDTYESLALRYRLVLDDENLQLLGGRRLHSDDLLDGAFVFEESELYYNVGVRYHGSPWNRPPDPKMFRIRFNDDKPLMGYNKINVSRYGSAPNEGTAYQLSRLATGGEDARSTYSPRYNYIKFYYNGRPHSGSTALAEIIPPGGDYFRTIFPRDSEGHAYKITGKLDFTDAGEMSAVSWTSYRYYGPSKESYRYFFNPATNQEQDDFDPLIRLMSILDPARTPLAKFDSPLEGLESLVNVDAWLRVFIIRVLQDDWDTIGIQNGQNSFIYHAPLEGRFYLLPWDLDHTFGDPNARLAPGDLSVDIATRRWMNDSPKGKRAYLRIMKEITSRFWSTAAMSPWLDAVANDTRGLVGSPGGIKSFMTSRAQAIRTRVPLLTRVVAFAITNPPGGKDLAVKASQATIGGTAPLELATMYVASAGEDPLPVEPVWTATSIDWKLTLPLKPGKNSFQVYGFTSAGAIVGSVLSINIHDATGWPAPTIASLSPSRGPVEGGTSFTITGEGFQEGVALTLSGKPASQVRLVSAREVQAVTPPADARGSVEARVTNLDGQNATLPGGFTYGSGASSFIRGDVDSSASLDLSDAIQILGYQFLGGALSCLDAGDADDTGAVDLSDPIHILNYLFNAGPAPLPPFPEPGEDTTEDELGCER